MSVAVLNDIHDNLPALEAVVAELRADPPDAVVVVGGDVAAGPQPVEADQWTATEIARAERDFLRSPTACRRRSTPTRSRAAMRPNDR